MKSTAPFRNVLWLILAGCNSHRVITCWRRTRKDAVYGFTFVQLDEDWPLRWN